jgi:hypothetical protein
MHADGALVVNGGDIDITECYEGLEGATVTVNNGNITLVSENDGFNAAGGTDPSSGAGPFGKDNFAASGDYKIEINGGTVSITVTSNGDGLDSNGDITIKGGTTNITCPTTGDTTTIDASGNYTLEGGTVNETGGNPNGPGGGGGGMGGHRGNMPG